MSTIFLNNLLPLLEVDMPIMVSSNLIIVSFLICYNIDFLDQITDSWSVSCIALASGPNIIDSDGDGSGDSSSRNGKFSKEKYKI